MNQQLNLLGYCTVSQTPKDEAITVRQTPEDDEAIKTNCKF